ncbi:MAG: hypothetical protein AAGF93_01850 [Cyanobacteria bacterium P01_H01_bin.105]
MVQLITCLLVVAALVILVLQNLSPVLSLVVLGSSVGALPFSVWLVGAIALGMLFTLLTYQLVPNKRAYRPIGKRLSEPEPAGQNTSNRNTGNVPPGRFQSPTDRQNPYDKDWESFKAPEQWDDWGQQQDARPRPSVGDVAGNSIGDSIGNTVRDIESGWGDDDYEASARYASRQEAGPDIGWHEGTGRAEDSDRPPSRTYEEGWLYGNDSIKDSTNDPSGMPEPGAPNPTEPDEDVYDANYRVIIPPYDTKDDKEN